jgi:hypothetical protein
LKIESEKGDSSTSIKKSLELLKSSIGKGEIGENFLSTKQITNKTAFVRYRDVFDTPTDMPVQKSIDEMIGFLESKKERYVYKEIRLKNGSRSVVFGQKSFLINMMTKRLL